MGHAYTEKDVILRVRTMVPQARTNPRENCQKPVSLLFHDTTACSLWLVISVRRRRSCPTA
jgi:hypothetical protein